MRLAAVVEATIRVPKSFTVPLCRYEMTGRLGEMSGHSNCKHIFLFVPKVITYNLDVLEIGGGVAQISVYT